jgi:hypothetical protein
MPRRRRRAARGQPVSANRSVFGAGGGWVVGWWWGGGWEGGGRVVGVWWVGGRSLGGQAGGGYVGPRKRQAAHRLRFSQPPPSMRGGEPSPYPAQGGGKAEVGKQGRRWAMAKGRRSTAHTSERTGKARVLSTQNWDCKTRAQTGWRRRGDGGTRANGADDACEPQPLNQGVVRDRMPGAHSH